MTKDPVCGMQVDENKGLPQSNYQGKQYTFCGNDCKQKFDRNPQQYIGQQQGGQQQGGQQQGGQQQDRHTQSGSQGQGGQQQRGQEQGGGRQNGGAGGGGGAEARAARDEGPRRGLSRSRKDGQRGSDSRFRLDAATRFRTLPLAGRIG